MKKLLVISSLFVVFLLLPTTNYQLLTVDAQVDINQRFPFRDVKTLGDGVQRLVAPTFSVAMVSVIIYFLLGAYKFISSGGNKDEIASGRRMIAHAIVGFMLLMFAFLILQFLLGTLFGITTLQIIK